MKRILCLLALVLTAHPLRAQETTENELAFVRQLRLKGWNDLARSRIEALLKTGNATLAAALPIELARVNIAEARQKDPEQRLTLFTTARAQLQDYLNKNKGKVDAALATAELARVTSYHAQAILSKAMRDDEDRVRHEKARPAETLFIEAGKELEAAAAAIEAALKDPGNAKMKDTLERELRQARFDAAINIFDQARTYIDKSQSLTNEKRAVTMKKAKDEFMKLRADESSEIGWLANAWLMKCAMEMTTPVDVNKYYEFVMKGKSKDSFAAVRLVGYFHLQDITLPREDAETIGNNAINDKLKLKKTAKDRLHDVQKEGEAWLKAYPSYHKTFEGQGVRFEVGYAYFTEARGEEDPKKKDNNAKVTAPLYEKATYHFDELAKLDSDLAERARQLSMAIKFQTLNLKGELKTFDEFWMNAMIKRRSVIGTSVKIDQHTKKAGGPDKATLDSLEAERKTHLKEVIASLNKALSLADNKTPVQKVDDARYFLCGAYVAYGDQYRGAIVAEALGRTRSTRRSPEGAQTAIATYAAMLSRDSNNNVVKQRLFDLCDFVLSPDTQRTWATEPVTSLAHFHLAMALGEAEPKKAMTHLAAIKSDYPDYLYTQLRLFFLSQAASEKADDKADQKWYLDQAKVTLAKLPKFDAQHDAPQVIAMYFFAKLEHPKFLYAEAFEQLNAREELKAIAKCNEMKKYVAGLRADFDKLPGGSVSPGTREQIDFQMKIMLKYSDLGIAEVKFRSDKKERFDEVLQATQNVVNDVLAKAKATPAGEPIRMKDYKVTGDILGLALRANVQKGDVPKGRAILEVLQRLSGTEPGQKPGPVVAILLRDIAGQIQDMKKHDPKNLAATKQNYTAFLDEIAKEYDKKGHDANSAVMLAHAYSSLEFPQKAAELFSKVQAPPNLDKKVIKVKDETEDQVKERQAWEDAVGRYWGVQIEYIRALRACKDKDSLDKAEKVITALVASPNARYKLQAQMERNYIYEDGARYREAYLSWSTFMKQPSISGVALQQKPVQEIYFEGYLSSVRTLYKMATLDPMIKDRQKFINGAANMIYKLETSKSREGWNLIGPKLNDLINDKEYDQLKKAYDALKKGSALDVPRRDYAAAAWHAIIEARVATAAIFSSQRAL